VTGQSSANRPATLQHLATRQPEAEQPVADRTEEQPHVTGQSSAKRPATLQQIAARQPVAEQPVADRPETQPLVTRDTTTCDGTI